ncbi:MAG: hypothetical protein M0R16_10250 [Bacteroidales bacterium]|jgi:hypothetical protein|nr:hypothetical protein [Bacteroidales bacterium]
MALIVNGFLGDAIGKLGNVVFRKWNALITASKYQPLVSNPNTPLQQLQRYKIKNLSQLLRPFKDSIIPLNFKNRQGRSTTWAEAVRANYPLLDDNGHLGFQDMILSGGNLLPPVILESYYNPFINQFSINFDLENQADIGSGGIRVTAVGRSLIDRSFNTENICKLPFKNSFSTYINEMVLPDWPLNFDFENAWSEGMFFYNIIKDPSRDVRSYRPANIVNTPSVGVYFSTFYNSYNFNFNIANRILMPNNFNVLIVEDDGTFFIKIGIDPYAGIPGLLPDDIIYILPFVLTANANQYEGPYTFTAQTGLTDFPLLEGDETKPFIFLYFVTDAAGVVKSAPARFYFNLPDTHTFAELIIKHGMAHPESIKIHDPYMAIWGDLKDFIPPDLIGTIPYTIHSKNDTTGEERQHVISSDNLFLCSKLLRNQVYTITIKDGLTIAAEFTVIGINEDYSFSMAHPRPRFVVRFRAGSGLAAKVK